MSAPQVATQPPVFRACIPDQTTRLPSDLLCRAQMLEAEIIRLDARVARRPYLVHGTEARFAAAILTGALSVDRFKLPPRKAPCVRGPSIQRFLFRAPIEAMAHVLLTQRDSSEHDRPTLEGLTSCLFNTPRRYRTRSVASAPDRHGARTVYPTWERIPNLLKIRDHRRPQDVGSGLGWAIHRLVDFVAIHPFDDGNGRVSRLLFFQDLAECLNISTYCMPLGPICYLNADWMVHCIRKMFVTGNPRDIIAFYLDILMLAIEAGYEVSAVNPERPGLDAFHRRVAAYAQEHLYAKKANDSMRCCTHTIHFDAHLVAATSA